VGRRGGGGGGGGGGGRTPPALSFSPHGGGRKKLKLFYRGNLPRGKLGSKKRKKKTRGHRCVCDKCSWGRAWEKRAFLSSGFWNDCFLGFDSREKTPIFVFSDRGLGGAAHALTARSWGCCEVSRDLFSGLGQPPKKGTKKRALGPRWKLKTGCLESCFHGHVLLCPDSRKA